MSDNVTQNHSGSGDNIIVYSAESSVESVTRLAIAVLIGSWDDTSAADRAVIECVSGEKYSEWIGKIRNIEGLSDSPIEHKDGKWFVKDRLNIWKNVASRIYDNVLDDFQDQAINVLSEVDPSLELPPEERYAAAIHGKVLKHSTHIRTGVSEGVAIIGNYYDFLKNCTFNKGHNVARNIVRSIFNNTTWETWASTNSLQSVLAEASPAEFIECVDKAMYQADKPFQILFSQERNSGITSRNYLTGLLWSLEGIAWHKDYLTEVILLLGELDGCDPGGNWANRPINSITEILLPQKPQTLASVEKRIAAITALSREYKDTAWRVISKIIFSHSFSIISNHKPKWFCESLILNDVSVSREDVITQIQAMNDLALKIAQNDNEKLCTLIKNSSNLSQATFTKLIDYLATYLAGESINSYDIWQTLVRTITRHRKFKDAYWSFNDEMLLKLDELEVVCKPDDLALESRILFSDSVHDLFEEKDNLRKQEEIIKDKQIDAINKISSKGGLDAVIDFAKTVENSTAVGQALASVWKTELIDSKVFHFLIDDNDNLSNLATAYISTCYYLYGDEWLSVIDISKAEPAIIVQILLSLPVNDHTWDMAVTYLGEKNEYMYWTSLKYIPFVSNMNYDRALDKFIVYKKPYMAISVINRQIDIGEKLDISKVILALKIYVELQEQEQVQELTSYYFERIIKYLQASSISQDDMIAVEWAYLSIFVHNENISPVFLMDKLASDPAYFCQLLEITYHPKNRDESYKPLDIPQHTVRQAHQLLDMWNKIPGTGIDGVFRPEIFEHWIEHAIHRATEVDRLDIALFQIGKVLFYSPASSDGLWIHLSVCEFINKQDNGAVRKGYANEVYNSRGVHIIHPNGKPELELEQKYRGLADQVDNAGYPRFSRCLREIAAAYANEAKALKERRSLYSI